MSELQETKIKRTFPTNDFYCVSRAITKGIDLYTSIIYGYIWSKCGLRDKKCTASYETISGELGISKKTIQRKIKLLIKYDLISDVSKSKYNFPGKSREYICNEEKLKEFKDNILNSEDSETILNKDSLSTIKNEVRTLSHEVRTFCPLSEDSESKSEDLKSVKVDLQLEGLKDRSKKENQNQNPDTDLLNQDQEQEPEQEQDRNLIDIKEWVVKTYELNDLPKYFDSILDELISGKRKNQKQPIQLNYLLEAWEETYESISHRSKPPVKFGTQTPLTGMERIKYDLSILVSDYPDFKEKKRAIKFENERQARERKENAWVSDWMKHYQNQPIPKPVKTDCTADYLDEI